MKIKLSMMQVMMMIIYCTAFDYNYIPINGSFSIYVLSYSYGSSSHTSYTCLFGTIMLPAHDMIDLSDLTVTEAQS